MSKRGVEESDTETKKQCFETERTYNLRKDVEETTYARTDYFYFIVKKLEKERQIYIDEGAIVVPEQEDWLRENLSFPQWIPALLKWYNECETAFKIYSKKEEVVYLEYIKGNYRAFWDFFIKYGEDWQKYTSLFFDSVSFYDGFVALPPLPLGTILFESQGLNEEFIPLGSEWNPKHKEGDLLDIRRPITTTRLLNVALFNMPTERLVPIKQNVENLPLLVIYTIRKKNVKGIPMELINNIAFGETFECEIILQVNLTGKITKITRAQVFYCTSTCRMASIARPKIANVVYVDII